MPERPRRIPRHAGEAFLDGQPEQRRRHVHGEQQRGERRGAGIAVGRDRHRHAVRAAARRPAASASRAGNRRRRAAARRRCRPPPSRRRPPRRDIRDDRRTARRSRAASFAPPRLESCSAWSFTGRPCCCAASKTRAICSGEKGDPLAEAVDRIGEPRRRDCGSCIVADLVDVAVLVARRLRRQRMRAEEGAHDRRRRAPRRAASRRAASSLRSQRSSP